MKRVFPSVLIAATLVASAAAQTVTDPIGFNVTTGGDLTFPDNSTDVNVTVFPNFTEPVLTTDANVSTDANVTVFPNFTEPVLTTDANVSTDANVTVFPNFTEPVLTTDANVSTDANVTFPVLTTDANATTADPNVSIGSTTMLTTDFPPTETSSVAETTEDMFTDPPGSMTTRPVVNDSPFLAVKLGFSTLLVMCVIYAL